MELVPLTIEAEVELIALVEDLVTLRSQALIFVRLSAGGKVIDETTVLCEEEGR
jgi:hypothetical protein